MVLSSTVSWRKMWVTVWLSLAPKSRLLFRCFRLCTTHVPDAMLWTWRKWTESIECEDPFNIAVSPPPPIGLKWQGCEQIPLSSPQKHPNAGRNSFFILSQKSAFLSFFCKKALGESCYWITRWPLVAVNVCWKGPKLKSSRQKWWLLKLKM